MKNLNFTVVSLSFLIIALTCYQATAGTAPSAKRPMFLPGASEIRQPVKPVNDGPSFAPPHAIVAPNPNGKISQSTQNSYFSETLLNPEQFDSMASLSTGLIKGAAVKFFIDNRTAPAKIYFLNGNFTEKPSVRPDYVKYHYYFAQKHLKIQMEDQKFNNSTYFTNDLKEKQFIAGTLQRYDLAQTSFYGIQFYPQDHIAEETLLFTLEIVKKALNSSFTNLAFVAYGTQQTISTIQPQSEGLRIKLLTAEQVYSGITYMPMNVGKTLGILKVKKPDQSMTEFVEELTPHDIPIFVELPLDLSVVAGVITTVIQDAGAHVNLKSKERNTPNMVLKDQAKLSELLKLDGMPIELTVGNEKFDYKSVSKAAVAEFHFKKSKSKKPSVIKNGNETTIALFDTLAAATTPIKLINSSSSYGGKASKLPLLAHEEMVGLGSVLQQSLGYRLTPMGFSIPIKYYFEFVKANSTLDQKLKLLIDKEMSLNGQTPPSVKERAVLVKEVQELFYSAIIPDSLFNQLAPLAESLKNQVLQTYPLSPLKKVKVRSSSNAEDIPNFDGAGLHSSFGAKIDKVGEANTPCRIEISGEGVATKEDMKPESIACAIKGVYASLWNKRAIEERNFAKIDQRSAGMALAVNMSYDFRDKTEKVNEIGNAVIVTRVINADGVYGYRLSLNTDENLVTNPTPNTQSEVVIASFMDFVEDPKLSYLQFAKPKAADDVLKQPLFTDRIYKTLIRVAQRVELNYCNINRKYYPNGNCKWIIGDLNRPTSLDMELKIYDNGEVLIKQVREFGGK